MNSEKKYPNIFIHGMLGWGEKEKMYNLIPYWGMLCGSLTKKLSARGLESYAVKVSPLGSAWDRACELYAIIAGTTVDYGKAHSEKYGHARFGRKYEKPLVKDWGKADIHGDIIKVNLLGHSFGGATMRVLVELLTNGCKAEIGATDKNDLSVLFEGGHGNLVHSITAISAPHEGTTLFYALPRTMNFASYFTFLAANILGNTKQNQNYDWMLDQWGLTSDPECEPEHSAMLNLSGIKKALDSKDNLWYDLTLHGAKEMNEHLTCCNDTYYFSVAGQMTQEDMLTGYHSHDRGMFIGLWPLAKAMGHYSFNTHNDIEIDKSWCANDGCLSTVSGLHPFNEPFVDYESNKANVKKGIWNVMHVETADHGKIIGGSLQLLGKSKGFIDYYANHIQMLNKLD